MYKEILNYCKNHQVDLVVVSKMRSIEEVLTIYIQGQRDFAENRVQNLLEKYESMPADIHWHLIGTLQTNKVKYIAPFITLIHSLDDIKLWDEIDKQGKKHNRVIPCLLQIKIAREETKSGFDWPLLVAFLKNDFWKKYDHVKIVGVMGMASFTEDAHQVRAEFDLLKLYYNTLQTDFFKNQEFKIISMGMSGDYKIAIEAGANMVRIGSLVFQ